MVTLVALIGGAAFWPWAQEQPLTRPFEAFFLASGFSWGNPSLFMGEAISGTAVPWYYLPTWIGITIPAVVLAGLAFAVVRLALPAPGRARLAALWALVLFPAVSAMARQVSLYDGMRHMLFIVPPMAVLAAAGWEFLLRSTPRPGLRCGCRRDGVDAGRAGRVSDPESSESSGVLHAGDRRPARRLRPVRSGLLGQLHPRGDRVGGCPGRRARACRSAWRRTHGKSVAMDAGRFNELYFRQQRHAGWHLNLLLLKGSTENITEIAADPGVLYRVQTADGTPLCVVLPGPDYPQARRPVGLRPSAAGEAATGR